MGQRFFRGPSRPHGVEVNVRFAARPVACGTWRCTYAHNAPRVIPGSGSVPRGLLPSEASGLGAPSQLADVRVINGLRAGMMPAPVAARVVGVPPPPPAWLAPGVVWNGQYRQAAALVPPPSPSQMVSELADESWEPSLDDLLVVFDLVLATDPVVLAYVARNGPGANTDDVVINAWHQHEREQREDLMEEIAGRPPVWADLAAAMERLSL